MEKIKNIIKSNKKNILIAIGVIIIIVVSVVVFSKRGSRPTNTTVPANTDETVLDGLTAETPVKPATKPAVSNAVSMSYADALVKYKDYRIQLGEGSICTATPRNVTYKNGSTIMLDNRSAISRSVTVGGTYSIGAYDFALVKLASNKTPETFYVDCNNQQNVATILIQD